MKTGPGVNCPTAIASIKVALDKSFAQVLHLRRQIIHNHFRIVWRQSSKKHQNKFKLVTVAIVVLEN
jgi:hypothetical protein